MKNCIKVALVGFGGIAQLHRYAYHLHNKNGLPVRLVAACDRDPSKFETVTKINLTLDEITDELPFNTYLDMDEMLQNEQPDLVDVCLPTGAHAPVTIDLLDRGYHVLCEKPMASTFEQCQQMLEAAKRNQRYLMIGQCLRFYPEYEYLQKLAADKTYGNVVESEFYRYTPLPDWSNDAWQANVAQSGGCLAELNIHDIDYVRWVFGDPHSVSCTIENRTTEADWAESKFFYDDHTVIIHSAWSDPSEHFVHGYEVTFENASVSMRGGEITLTENGKEPVKVEVSLLNGIIGEIAYFTQVLADNAVNEKNPPESSAQTIFTLETLRKSDKENRIISL